MPLYVLLGEVEPFNSFEIYAMLGRVQSELNIPSVASETEAEEILATGLIRQHLMGSIDVADIAENLKDLWWLTESNAALYDFCLLHWAHEDCADGEVQWYWPSQSCAEIDATIHNKCIAWRAAHPLTQWHAVEWAKSGDFLTVMSCDMSLHTFRQSFAAAKILRIGLTLFPLGQGV